MNKASIGKSSGCLILNLPCSFDFRNNWFDFRCFLRSYSYSFVSVLKWNLDNSTMNELHTICETYRNLDLGKQNVALATVVQVRGSSYRSPGARMLIIDDGRWFGSISGGCLEGDALRKARQVMREKTPLCVTYDTRDDENKSLGINLGCNGVIDVLFEAVDPDDMANPMHFFKQLINLQQEVAVATIFSGSEAFLGKKMVVKQTFAIDENIQYPDLCFQLEKDLIELLGAKKSRAQQYTVGEETFDIFLELIQPPIQLLIFGGGFDARPLSQLAKNLGWNVTVTDECVAHIAPVFFPQADTLSLCHREFVDQEFVVQSNTACVLMSHNYEYDRDILKKLLKTTTPYIGILGPKKRFEKMIAEFIDQGIYFSDKDWDRIHAPIGLDIGAETPYEIAVAITAEVMGRFTRRQAGFLKLRQGPIHHRDTQSDQVFKEATL
ncbi:XdhC family protein [Cytophagaceae bacterium YF14B1]|uniref:XdhC family protein n=1 Tax=Xanthocytophaga flava TaxID=3048013 RepID=A0AAE3UAH4_9BACT|nr:XdhC/CoxI family protein [Xanthocytophaga flavus]MDJ1482794.1 XdhC family protein [Xanthocytophaga flavus]